MASKTKTAVPEVVNVAISKIEVDANPRKDFDKNGMDGLTASIKAQGILLPLVAREVDGKTHLVAGERRLRAAKAAGQATVPVIYREMTEEQVLEVQLIENLQRADLAPTEEAKALKQLVDRGMTQREISLLLGKSEGWVSGRLRMLELPKATQKLVEKGKVTVEQAVSLLPYAGTAVMEEMGKNLEEHVRVYGKVSTADVKEEVIGTALANEEFVFRFGHRFNQYNQQELKEAFGLEDCHKCPDKKEIPDTWGEGTEEACLKKECWERKLKEARKKVRAKHTEKNAKDRAKDEKSGIIDLDKHRIAHVDFERDNYSRPKFDVKVCQGCKSHKRAKDNWHKTPYPICVDPHCFNEMQQAYVKAIEKLRKEVSNVVVMNMNDRTENGKPKQLAPNEMRLVMFKVMGGRFVDDKLKVAFAPWIPKKPKKGWLSALNQVPDDELMLALFRFVVLDEAEDIRGGKDAVIETPLHTYDESLLKDAILKLDVKVEPTGREPKGDRGVGQAAAEALEENGEDEEAELEGLDPSGT